MTAGRVSTGLACVAALALAACDAGEPKQDMAFVEGCWVLRWNSDESVSMRTHIAQHEDGRTYRGIVREFGNAAAPGEASYEFIFDRGGRWLEMDNHAPDSLRRLSSAPRPRLVATEPIPEILPHLSEQSDRLATFRFEGGDWVIVSRTGDYLWARLVHADSKPGQTYFGGERETCP
jgi:hypothetical protein